MITTRKATPLSIYQVQKTEYENEREISLHVLRLCGYDVTRGPRTKPRAMVTYRIHERLRIPAQWYQASQKRGLPEN